MDIQQYMQRLGEQARQASRAMARANSGDKDKALAAIANALRNHRDAILRANEKDLEAGRSNGLLGARVCRGVHKDKGTIGLHQAGCCLAVVKDSAIELHARAGALRIV